MIFETLSLASHIAIIFRLVGHTDNFCTFLVFTKSESQMLLNLETKCIKEAFSNLMFTGEVWIFMGSKYVYLDIQLLIWSIY